VSEDEGSVSFAFTNGTKASADILIGADGIHSTVHKHLFPDVVPKYSGSVAITCALDRNKLELPSNTPDYPCRLQSTTDQALSSWHHRTSKAPRF
jgi:2-polyprenyl-6-methoxyphenol hydroxylase-like FAD-dependent oxidoreductase